MINTSTLDEDNSKKGSSNIQRTYNVHRIERKQSSGSEHHTWWVNALWGSLQTNRQHHANQYPSTIRRKPRNVKISRNMFLADYRCIRKEILPKHRNRSVNDSTQLSKHEDGERVNNGPQQAVNLQSTCCRIRRENKKQRWSMTHHWINW